MKYFKIVYSYGNDESYIQIKGEELHRAYALFKDPKGRAVFSGGAVSSMDIKRIVPDWNRHFGWNQTYEMVKEDYNLVNAIKSGYDAVQEKAQLIAEYAFRENRQDILKFNASEAFALLPQKNQENSAFQVEGVNKFKMLPSSL